MARLCGIPFVMLGGQANLVPESRQRLAPPTDVLDSTRILFSCEEGIGCKAYRIGEGVAKTPSLLTQHRRPLAAPALLQDRFESGPVTVGDAQRGA